MLSNVFAIFTAISARLREHVSEQENLNGTRFHNINNMKNIMYIISSSGC